MRVGFDLDGVLYDFGDSCRAYYRTLNPLGTYDDAVNADVTDWHFYRSWGMNDKGFKKFCDDGVDAGYIFTYGDPHPGTVEAVNRIYSLGHRVVIITDRPFGKNGGKNSRRATFKWLRKHGVKFHEVHFTANKDSVNVDTMIDDKVENFVDLRDAGVDVYLLDRPWNQHIDAGHRRIDSIEEYIYRVEEKTYAFA